jgi:1-deoxy-D-xylulose-5-phosphate synthase
VNCPVERIAWPDAFIDHGSSVKDLRQRHGLAPEQMLKRIHDRYQKLVGKLNNDCNNLSSLG